MEKVLASDMSKILILLGGGVVSLSALWVRFVTKVRGSFKPYQKATLLYVLLSLLFFAAIAVTSHPDVFSATLAFFIFYQVCFLLFGSLHCHFMHKHLKWSGDEKAFWPELIFTLVVGMFGGFLFITVHRLLNDNGLQYIMAGSIGFFIIPFFFYHTFRTATGIPPKIRKQWLYPLHEEVEEPDESKLKNLLVISFEFEKQNGDAHATNFRAKAPTDMEFSRLFYYFINDYNERHPNGKIQVANGSGEPYAWIFYKKPKWHSFFTRYIDTDKTIYNNRIRENDVIICSRSLN